MTSEGATRRYIPPGSCSWCGHQPHDRDCGSTIRALVDTRLGTRGGEHEAPCPCTRHLNTTVPTVTTPGEGAR